MKNKELIEKVKQEAFPVKFTDDEYTLQTEEGRYQLKIRKSGEKKKNIHKITGEEVKESIAKKFGSSSHVILPKSWKGHKVVIVRKPYKEVCECSNCGKKITTEVYDFNTNKENPLCLSCLKDKNT